MLRKMTCVLAVSLALGTSACAGAGAIGQVTKTAHPHISLWQTGWCAFHVWRLEQDVRNGHLGWGAFQAILSFHHCRRVAHL